MFRFQLSFTTADGIPRSPPAIPCISIKSALLRHDLLSIYFSTFRLLSAIFPKRGRIRSCNNASMQLKLRNVSGKWIVSSRMLRYSCCSSFTIRSLLTYRGHSICLFRWNTARLPAFLHIYHKKMAQSPRKWHDTGFSKCGQPHRKEIHCACVHGVRGEECIIRYFDYQIFWRYSM